MNDRTLSRDDRIRTRSDFKRIFDTNTTHANDVYRVLATDSGTTRSRLGVVVKKALGNAVQRNREKRLVRELFRTNRDVIPGGYDYIVIIRRRIEIAFSVRQEKFVALFKRYQRTSA
ncbi:MAG: ribonuclease P protein component [Spirochaetes bacterium]|nr:ribonuclease P protein component [Spirochaetota bacterium]